MEADQPQRSFYTNVHVRDDGGCYGTEGRLPNTGQHPERREPPERIRERIEQGGHAREQHTQHHDPFPRITIAQIANHIRK